MGYFKDQSIPGDGPDVVHDELCPAYCPYPDTNYIAPGSSLPKCRGGDCTLCDESDCICPIIRAVERRTLNSAREAVEQASSLLQPLGPALAAIDALESK